MSVDAIVKQIEELTLDQRAEVLHRVERGMLDAGWESDIELSDEMKTLLDERNAEADANPGVGYTVEEVIEYLSRSGRLRSSGGRVLGNAAQE